MEATTKRRVSDGEGIHGEASRAPVTRDNATRRDGRARLTSLDVELGEQLGRGSYGTVFRAAAAKVGGPCAVKILPWGPADVTADMKRELKLMQRCSSDYLIRAHGAFSKPKELWIVMELCTHGSLLDVMRATEHTLTEAAVAAACRDACHGLHYLHTHAKGRVIHRDIKCANLLLSAEHGGRVKLADFGVAAQLNSTASKRNSVIGTPHWMAPEVVQNGHYDARADVWSLGIAAMEMAQARPPLIHVRPVLRVMFSIAQNPPPTLDEPALFSDALNAFVAATLVKDANERPTADATLRHPFLAGIGDDTSALRLLIDAADAALARRLANPKPNDEAEDDVGTLGLVDTFASTMRRHSTCSPELGGDGGGTMIFRGAVEAEATSTKNDADTIAGTMIMRGCDENLGTMVMRDDGAGDADGGTCVVRAHGGEGLTAVLAGIHSKANGGAASATASGDTLDSLAEAIGAFDVSEPDATCAAPPTLPHSSVLALLPRASSGASTGLYRAVSRPVNASDLAPPPPLQRAAESADDGDALLLRRAQTLMEAREVAQLEELRETSKSERTSRADSASVVDVVAAAKPKLSRSWSAGALVQRQQRLGVEVQEASPSGSAPNAPSPPRRCESSPGARVAGIV